MADKALENAKMRRELLAERINKAQQEIEELRREIRRVDQFIDDWHRYAEAAPMMMVDSAPTEAVGALNLASAMNMNNALETFGSFSSKPRGPRSINSKKEEVADAACKIITERGEPIMRSELYSLLIARGLVITGSNPEMVLSTMLWRMKDKIVRMKSGGYWPHDLPYDPAGYQPGDLDDDPEEEELYHDDGDHDEHDDIRGERE